MTINKQINHKHSTIQELFKNPNNVLTTQYKT